MIQNNEAYPFPVQLREGSKILPQTWEANTRVQKRGTPVVRGMWKRTEMSNGVLIQCFTALAA